jgi:hypothetical protein
MALVTGLLGVLVVLSLLASHLALTDIWHGTEPNLDSEWNVVRASFLMILLFLIFVYGLIYNIFKTQSRLR